MNEPAAETNAAVQPPIDVLPKLFDARPSHMNKNICSRLGPSNNDYSQPAVIFLLMLPSREVLMVKNLATKASLPARSGQLGNA